MSNILQIGFTAEGSTDTRFLSNIILRTFEKALRLAYSETPKRRRKLSLSNLYSPISQEISLEKLQQLQSYRIFVEHVKESLHYLNYL